MKNTLRSKATKPSAFEVTDRLLSKVMKQNDDIWAFKAVLQTEYNYYCEALGQRVLKKTFDEILSFTITAGMSNRSIYLYRDQLINNCEKTMYELEHVMRNSVTRNLLFDNNEEKTIIAKETSHHESLSNHLARSDYSSSKLCNTYVNRVMEPIILSDDRDNKAMQLKIDGHNLYKDQNTKRNVTNQLSRTYQSPTSDISRPTRNNERLKVVSKWYDWKCQKCSQINPGHFSKCLNCKDQATLRQIPSDSWRCTACPHGRNNWSNYNYCSSCLEPNQNVPRNKLCFKPKLLKTFGREMTWSPILPVINP